MEQVSELKKFVRETIKDFPQLKEEVTDLFQLCLDEIDEGNSVDNECNLCRRDIEELILNHK
jgi:bacterioferritin-associated ferredoxin